MRQELVKTWAELFEAQKEVTSLRLQLSEHSGKLLEVDRKLELEKVEVAKLSREKEVLQQQLSTSEQQGLREQV